MAINVNFNGASIRKPGAVTKTTTDLSGGFPLSPAGIVGIIGEAEAGAPGSAVAIKDNFFSPEQESDIIALYKSGPIVDAAKILFAPSADSRIANGASRIYVYKTNASTKATGTMTGAGTVDSINYGLAENLINFQVTAGQSEALWGSGSLNFMVDGGSGSSLKARVDGGAEQTATIAANDTQTTVASVIAALTGFNATGGVDRGVLAAGQVTTGTVQLASTGNVVTITIAANTWAVTPTVGDTLQIRSGSAIVSGVSNLGAYIVTAATSTVITAEKLSDPSVACANIGPVDIAATTDVLCYSPIVVTQDSTTQAGSAATAELYDGTGVVAMEELVYGSVDRGMLSATKVSDGSTIALAVVSTVGTFTISSSWAGTVTAGDVLWVRPGSVLAGGSLQNVGAWRVTASSATTITATKITGAPIAVAAIDIAATKDLVVFKGLLSNSATPIVNTSSAELQRLITVNRQSDNVTEDSSALGGNVALMLGYVGTTGTVSVTATKLTTSVTGGSGANLDITLAAYATLNDLATYINSQTGYSCAVGNALYGQSAPSVLDRVTALGIGATVATDKTGRIKKDSSEVAAYMALSSLVALTRTSFAGLPSTNSAKVFLSGGAKGGTSAASAVAGIDAMQKVRINSILPLFSQDATADIIAGLTESSSTYQIDAINAAAKTHCILMSNTKNRSERNAYVSYKGTYVASKAAANNLASERCSLAIQDVKILKTNGTLDWVNPWGLAAVAAGMQAGAVVGEPMTFKIMNVSGIRHADFDPATQYDDAIDNGVLFAEQPQNGGFRFVLGNTTYAADASFVKNRISVLYCADTFAYNLRLQYEAIFTGVSTAVADPTSIKNMVQAYAATCRNAGIICGDSTNEGLGFKNLTVEQVGSTFVVKITITPTQGVDFILTNIVLDNIRASA